MVFWIIMILLALHIVGAFFMTPPTSWADKFFNTFAKHPKLKNENVSSIMVNGVQLSQDRKEQFVAEFNEANFLYDGGIIHEQSRNPIMVEIKQAKSLFSFKMYLYGDGMVEIIRYKKNKYMPYRVRSQALEQELLSYVATAS
ncbi:YfmQ family protein [Alicyclobacillus fodiniaquatilis]|jgi:hypothetical protein|uniref:YfmQ family protein n=1 Tax=Alicyclobacillus fodiniaquatilis TaxID=1661150 RepID=A0ABW4JFA5_9BACL